MGEGSDVSQGTGEGTKGCSAGNEEGTEEENDERGSVGRKSPLCIFYQRDLLRTLLPW